MSFGPNIFGGYRNLGIPELRQDSALSLSRAQLGITGNLCSSTQPSYPVPFVTVLRVELGTSSHPLTGPEFWLDYHRGTHARIASSCGHANYKRVFGVAEEGFHLRLDVVAILIRVGFCRVCGVGGGVVNWNPAWHG